MIKPRVAGLLTKEELAFLNEKEKQEDKEFQEVMNEYDEASSGEEDSE